MLYRAFPAFLLLLLCALLAPEFILAQPADTCNPCKKPDPIPLTPVVCTPSPTPTRTATPTPTATATPTTSACIEVPFVHTNGICKYDCKYRYCGGVLTGTSCGPPYDCNYCFNVQPVAQCYCAPECIDEQGETYASQCAAIIQYDPSKPANQQIGHTYTYGRDGSTICWYEICRRCDDGDSFDPETKVLLASGKYIKVKDLKSEDLLMNPDGGEPLRIKRILQGRETVPLFVIESGSLSLKVTRYHLVMTDQGLKQARHLSKGDTLLLYGGKKSKIDNIKEVPAAIDQQAYGIILDTDGENEDNYLLVSEGMIVGDYSLEVKYRKLQ